MKWRSSAGVALVLLLVGSDALAQTQSELEPSNHAASEQIFRYEEPADVYWLRVVLEHVLPEHG